MVTPGDKSVDIRVLTAPVGEHHNLGRAGGDLVEKFVRLNLCTGHVCLGAGRVYDVEPFEGRVGKGSNILVVPVEEVNGEIASLNVDKVFVAAAGMVFTVGGSGTRHL